MKGEIFRVSLSIILIIGFLPMGYVQAASFPDIRSTELREAVDYLNEQDIIRGYPDGTFKPEQTINRAEALKIILKTTDYQPSSSNSQPIFPDVDPNEWHAPYIVEANRQGIVQGYPDGTFKPTQFVNKVEFIKMAVIAQEYYDSPDNEFSAIRQFTDLDEDEWYMPFVSFANTKGFLERNAQLNPTAPMSRGEAALIIYKISIYNESLKNSDNLSTSEIWEAERYEIDNTPMKKKSKVEEIYPELYERAIGIHGGYQIVNQPPSFDIYNDYELEGIYVKNKDGVNLNDCYCFFEDKIISKFNKGGFFSFYYQGEFRPEFESWIKSEDAKEFIYDTAYWYDIHPEYYQ